jgi:hypothetical protein
VGKVSSHTRQKEKEEMKINQSNPYYGRYMMAELAIQSKKLRLYPHHHIDCIIHEASDVCNCGREEFEEEVAAEESEAYMTDEDSSCESETDQSDNEEDAT